MAAQFTTTVIGRGVYYPDGADTGFFYGGTWQGTKKMLGVRQGVDWSPVDGGDFIAALPKQDVILLEGGYRLHGGRFTPFFQYNARDFDRAALADQQTYQVGVAFWLKGHARNVKASVGEQRTDGRPNRLQALLQLQVFSY